MDRLFDLSDLNDTDIGTIRPPNTVTRNDGEMTRDDKIVVMTTVLVFCFPILIIGIICLLRVRVHLLDVRDKKKGRRRQQQECMSSVTILTAPISRENSMINEESIRLTRNTSSNTGDLSSPNDDYS
ncbi:uncharacterized protein LOC141908959 [Tubulanus polymorphus]|uniref:uncharacterized protein LOC141908959 n=1 Tax=Tubulanus polymorphus TaxID=672921 RepID=UPI003DA21A50